MDPFQSESISEYSHLKSNDEKKFYGMAVDYFYKRVDEYRGKYTIIFFSGDQGLFEIISKISFDSDEDLGKFHENVGRRDYHLILGKYKRGFELIFNGQFQSAVEIFGKVRRVIYCIYDQDLKDIVEGKKQLPPRTSAFRDMIIGKVHDMHAQAKATSERKLAS